VIARRQLDLGPVLIDLVVDLGVLPGQGCIAPGGRLVEFRQQDADRAQPVALHGQPIAAARGPGHQVAGMLDHAAGHHGGHLGREAGRAQHAVQTVGPGGRLADPALDRAPGVRAVARTHQRHRVLAHPVLQLVAELLGIALVARVPVRLGQRAPMEEPVDGVGPFAVVVRIGRPVDVRPEVVPLHDVLTNLVRADFARLIAVEDQLGGGARGLGRIAPELQRVELAPVRRDLGQAGRGVEGHVVPLARAASAVGLLVAHFQPHPVPHALLEVAQHDRLLRAHQADVIEVHDRFGIRRLVEPGSVEAHIVDPVPTDGLARRMEVFLLQAELLPAAPVETEPAGEVVPTVGTARRRLGFWRGTVAPVDRPAGMAPRLEMLQPGHLRRRPILPLHGLLQLVQSGIVQVDGRKQVGRGETGPFDAGDLQQAEVVKADHRLGVGRLIVAGGREPHRIDLIPAPRLAGLAHLGKRNDELLPAGPAAQVKAVRVVIGAVARFVLRADNHHKRRPRQGLGVMKPQREGRIAAPILRDVLQSHAAGLVHPLPAAARLALPCQLRFQRQARRVLGRLEALQDQAARRGLGRRQRASSEQQKCGQKRRERGLKTHGRAHWHGGDESGRARFRGGSGLLC